MKNTISFIFGFIALVVTGCQTAPMTARSKLDVKGELAVVERTTTVVIDASGHSTTNVIEKLTTKTSAAGDLELKSKELEGRTKVGVSQNRVWFPYSYGGGYGGTVGDGTGDGFSGNRGRGIPMNSSIR